MSAWLVLGIVTLAQAPDAPAVNLREFLPQTVGATYSYWCEFGAARDPLEMRVTEVTDAGVTLEGFPAPWSIATGGPAGASVMLRVDDAVGTILASDGQRERPLCTVAPGSVPGPCSTWAADYPEGFVCALTAEPVAVTGQVMLAREVGIVAIIFESPQGKGEYVLVKGPDKQAAEPEAPAITAFRPWTAYTYKRTDQVGESEITCKVRGEADLTGTPGVSVLGLPWFDQAGERPLAERERTVAVDIPERWWRELVDGQRVDLFSFNLAPVAGSVVVPGGTFDGCFRVTSAKPGLEAILHPDTGFIRWSFDTIVGPVTYDLVRVEPLAPPNATTGPTTEPITRPQPTETATEPGPEPVTAPETTAEPVPGPVTPPEELAPESEAGAKEPGPAHGALVWADAAGLNAADAQGAAGSIAKPDGHVDLVAASADGAAVAYVASDDKGWTLNVVAPPDGVRRMVSLGTREALVTSIEWSPDGGRLLYSVGRQVYVYDIASATEISLCTGDNPQWTHTGDVLYESGAQPDDEEVGVLRLPAAGGPPQMVGPWGFDASASADGRVLAYVSPQHDDDPRVHVTVDGADSELAGSNRFDRGPAVSPDGRFVVIARYVAADGPGSWMLRIADRVSGLERPVVTGSPSWPITTFWRDGSVLVEAVGPDGARSWGLLADTAAALRPLFAAGAPAPTAVAPFGARSRR